MRVHMIGAAGYGAGDILRFLERHPHVEIGKLESGSSAGEALGTVFPELRRSRAGSLRFSERGSVFAHATPGDVVVCAGNHELALEIVPQLLERGLRVIDLSDAFRLDWEKRGAVYGYPERYRSQIKAARLIANPGCFPTTTLLGISPLAPFTDAMTTIILDIKSGISGAGRSPKTGSLFAEVEGDLKPYGLNGHRHIPEIAQELAAIGIVAPFTFTPQVVPITRGMSGALYVVFDRAPDIEKIATEYKHAYAESAFVRILHPAEAPSLRAVARSNDAEISMSLQGNTLRVLCAIDNLGKGAAGQAVQNLNIMCGFPEETALS